MSLSTTFRNRLRKAVDNQRKHYPIKVIAHRAGYSKGYLERLLSGKQANPTLQTVESFAGATNVNVAWLLGLDGLE